MGIWPGLQDKTWIPLKFEELPQILIKKISSYLCDSYVIVFTSECI